MRPVGSKLSANAIIAFISPMALSFVVDFWSKESTNTVLDSMIACCWFSLTACLEKKIPSWKAFSRKPPAKTYSSSSDVEAESLYVPGFKICPEIETVIKSASTFGSVIATILSASYICVYASEKLSISVITPTFSKEIFSFIPKYSCNIFGVILPLIGKDKSKFGDLYWTNSEAIGASSK